MKYVLYFDYQLDGGKRYFYGSQEFSQKLSYAKLFSLEEVQEKYNYYKKLDTRYNYISYDELIVRKIIE